MDIFPQPKNQPKPSKKPLINKSEVVVGEKEPQLAKTAPASLRELPKHIAQTFTTDVIGGVLDGFTRQLLGQPIIGSESRSVSEPSASQEAHMWKRKFLHAERRRQEERTLLVEKQRQTEQKIVFIRQELQMQMATLGRDVISMTNEVQVAAFQSPVDPDIYHENFFEKLVSFIKNLRHRITQARHWLKIQNAKAAKKKGLWSLAQKGNTYNQEILYSGERAVSMSG